MSSPLVPLDKAEVEWRDGGVFLRHGAVLYAPLDESVQQGTQVFIEGNQLVSRWQALPAKQSTAFVIAETGFGAGLHFLLSSLYWERFAPESARLHFISCEKQPLSRDDLQRVLAHWPEVSHLAEALLKQYPVLTPGYHRLEFAQGRVVLTLMLGDSLSCYEQLLICGEAKLERSLRSYYVDAWFLNQAFPDAFCSVMAMLSQKNTTFSARSSDSVLIEPLSAQGFSIQVNQNTIFGTYHTPQQLSLRKRYTPWHADTPISSEPKSALVIGAGLAGCFCAYTLAKRGFQVTLLDELDDVAQGGSGNQQAILFPKLSAYQSPLTEFMLASFLYASQVYTELLTSKDWGVLQGAMVLAYNEKEKKALGSLTQWLAHYPELGRLVDSLEASALAGLALEHSGLFIPLSGWINMPALCRELINRQSITFVPQYRVDNLHYDGSHWVVNDMRAPVLVLANANKLSALRQAETLPLKSMRGQMSAVAANATSQRLNMPLCAQGHVLPAQQGKHYFGATYQPASGEATVCAKDDQQNRQRLQQVAVKNIWSEDIIDHWAGIRAATPDYLPLVGPVADADAFLAMYAGLASNSKRWIAKAGAYYPGLYTCAGFGSRGLTTIPLSAEYLAALINHEPPCLPRNLIQALSPARFLRKKLITQ